MKLLWLSTSILILLAVAGYPILARNTNLEHETWNMERAGDNVWTQCSQRLTSNLIANLQPRFMGLHMSNSPVGPPVSQFSYGITTVYAVFDYTDAQDTEVRLKVFPPWATGPEDWFFNRTYTYTGTGTASITVTYPSGVFPADPLPENTYRTILYVVVAGNDTPTASAEWRVIPPTATPTWTPTGPPPPTNTPTPTRTATSIPSPTLANGDFETGSLAPWILCGVQPPTIASSQAMGADCIRRLIQSCVARR